MRDLAAKIHWDVLTHFVYVPDKELHPKFFDHWMSHADTIESGIVFRDDCDGFALTCAELLIRRGANSEDAKIIFCRTETGGGHLATAWRHWILDNRHRTIMYWDDLPYEWVKSMAMNEKGIWRKV